MSEPVKFFAEMKYKEKTREEVIACISSFNDNIIKIQEIVFPPKLPEINWNSPETIHEQLKHYHEKKTENSKYKAPFSKVIEEMAKAISLATKNLDTLKLYSTSCPLHDIKENLDLFSEMIETCKKMVINSDGNHLKETVLDQKCYDSLNDQFTKIMNNK